MICGVLALYGNILYVHIKICLLLRVCLLYDLINSLHLRLTLRSRNFCSRLRLLGRAQVQLVYFAHVGCVLYSQTIDVADDLLQVYLLTLRLQHILEQIVELADMVLVGPRQLVVGGLASAEDIAVEVEELTTVLA